MHLSVVIGDSQKMKNLFLLGPPPSSASSGDFLYHFCFYYGDIHHALVKQARIALKYTKYRINGTK